jgi:Ca2+/H+ antiporter
MVPDGRSPGSTDPDRRERPSRRWIIASVLSVALIVLIVALLAPTFRRQEQYAALRERGVTTEARIEYCSSTVGSNLTFSGGITCPATFGLHGASVSEDLLGLPAQLRTGAEVRVVADPQNARDVYPLSDLRTDYKSGWVSHDTLIAILAALLLVATIASQVIVVRKRRSARSES